MASAECECGADPTPQVNIALVYTAEGLTTAAAI